MLIFEYREVVRGSSGTFQVMLKYFDNNSGDDSWNPLNYMLAFLPAFDCTQSDEVHILISWTIIAVLMHVSKRKYQTNHQIKQTVEFRERN